MQRFKQPQDKHQCSPFPFSYIFVQSHTQCDILPVTHFINIYIHLSTKTIQMTNMRSPDHHTLSGRTSSRPSASSCFFPSKTSSKTKNKLHHWIPNIARNISIANLTETSCKTMPWCLSTLGLLILNVQHVFASLCEPAMLQVPAHPNPNHCLKIRIWGPYTFTTTVLFFCSCNYLFSEAFYFHFYLGFGSYVWWS